jgi:hypothetical protein
MTFTSGAFFVFFLFLLIFYWLLSKTGWQNRLLLAASYIFNPLQRWMLKHGHSAASLWTWLIPPIVTMFASGLWHGAGWNYIAWSL